ncbi:MAG: site-specific DNA-methyltransferase [Hyphomicrobiaceae bacterium]|nr:site-specific DNA-methyltransferase [Hyphomicrobiaceae bacterium]
MTVEILVGDCRERMAELPDGCVQTCVTSPPYFGLRDYGVDGQIGAEVHPNDFCNVLVEVFREVRRVLRDDGTVWLNLGDSYCNTDKWGGGGDTGKNTIAPDGAVPSWAVRRKRPKMDGLKPKDRMMIPARVALALQADGWWLRDEIIWHKPNPMPASVTDRTTPAHEMIYLLSKSPRYFYDVEAVKEPAKRWPGHTSKRQGEFGGKGAAPGTGQSAFRAITETRNRRSVWTVTTKPFKGAHFATFPPDLIEPCILAGCPIGGTVLDPFGGAGTTGLVAQAHGRNAILCELNPEYASIARDRIDEAAATPLAAKKIRAKRAPKMVRGVQTALFGQDSVPSPPRPV